MIRRASMGLGKRPYALRVGMLEAVEGLVVVADDAKRSGRAQQVDHSLLGFVQILILVDQNMIIHRALWGGGVVAKVAIQFGDDLPDQHTLMELQPRDETQLEGHIHL